MLNAKKMVKKVFKGDKHELGWESGRRTVNIGRSLK